MRRTYERDTKARLSFCGGPHAPVNMADGMEDVNQLHVTAIIVNSNAGIFLLDFYNMKSSKKSWLFCSHCVYIYITPMFNHVTKCNQSVTRNIWSFSTTHHWRDLLSLLLFSKIHFHHELIRVVVGRVPEIFVVDCVQVVFLGARYFLHRYVPLKYIFFAVSARHHWATVKGFEAFVASSFPGTDNKIDTVEKWTINR